MIRLLFVFIMLMPAVVFAKPTVVSVIGPSNASEFINLVGEEVKSLMTESVEVKTVIYEPSSPVSKIDEVIRNAEKKSQIVVLTGIVAVGRGETIGLSKSLLGLLSSVKAASDSSIQYIVTEDIDYENDIRAFKKLINFDRIKILQSSYAVCSSKLCSVEMKGILENIDTPYELLKVDSADNDFAKMGIKSGDALLVLRQPQMTNSEYRKMLNDLADLGAVTFSFGKYDDIENGIIAINSTEKDYVKLARTASIGVLELAEGFKGEKVAKVSRAAGLVINMKQAKKANFYPRWEEMRFAELVYDDEAAKHDNYIGYKDALEQAIKNNEDVATSKVELESAKEMLNMAKSAFKPTVDFSTSFARIDKDRARFARGTAPEKTIDVTLKLQQIIYSEEVFKLRDQAVFNRKAKEFLSDQAKLDIIQESSKAYLNVLRAETYLDITRDNLETTKANYELAKARHLAGAANPAELHRWEANIAMARKDKFSAETSVKLAMTELARVIGEDVDSEYDLENLRIFSDHTIFSASKSHIDMIDNDRSFRKFKTFMAKRAVEKSSELAAIDQLLKSGKRSVQSAERAYTHPTIALGGEYKRFLDKSGEGDEAAGYDDKEWNIGISLSIPIYEGGKRSAELQIEKANLRKTLYERSKIVKLVKQRMVAALENGRSAYTSYVLAKSAAKAANETFEIMTDLYSKGAISITELIDSQNAMLAAQLNVAASEYDFLEKMVDVERAYGQFFVFKTESEKRDFADLIKNIMN